MATKKPLPYDLRLGPVNVVGPSLLWSPRPDEWVLVPETITAQVETDDYIADVVTGVGSDDRPCIVELTVRAKDGRAVSADLVRRLGVGDLLAQIVDRGATRAVRDPDNPDRVRFDLSGGVPGASVRALRRGRRPDRARIDDEIAAAANAYRDAVRRNHRAPVEYVADVLGLSRRSATRRLTSARERGLLTGETE